MTVDQIIALTGHIAWPIAAIIGLLLLPLYIPHIAKLTGLITELKSLPDQADKLLNSWDKITESIKKFDQLKNTLAPLQQISELKVQLDALLDKAVANSTSPPETTQNVGAWLDTVRAEWGKVKEAVVRLASHSGITDIGGGDIGFAAFNTSTASVQRLADRLIEKQVIESSTAKLMTDLSAQFQLWTRSRNRAALLNDDAVSVFKSDAARLIDKICN
jgi:hypothetical protein